MEWSNDPVSDAVNYAAHGERFRIKYPVCSWCGVEITDIDEYYYEIDGDCICGKCLDNEYRKSVYDYINKYSGD